MALTQQQIDATQSAMNGCKRVGLSKGLNLSRSAFPGIRISSGDLAEDESHSLREFSLETKIGNLNYYFGYQKGEAAPLFRAIETTQAGILLKFGDQFQCSKPPDGANLTCDKL